MSPKKQPSTLKSISSKMLTFNLIYSLLDEGSVESLRDYLSTASHNVLEMLQQEIVNLLNFDASIRFTALQLLLREDVKHLETGMFPRFYYEQILVTITEKGLRLQTLNLRGVWVRDYPQLLSKLIDNLPELKCLEIPHMATDTVIKSINNLKKLTVLDISGDGGYTREGIKCLKNSGLKVLNIGSYGKMDLCFDSESNYELVADIIENLPALCVLKTYSFAGHALLVLHKRYENFKTKLTYIYDTYMTKEIFEAVVATCPNLSYAHVSAPHDGVVAQFAHFKKLNSLKLTRGDKTEFLTLLAQSENNIEILQLNHNRDEKLDLGETCRSAPRLKHLECFQMSLKFSNPENLSLKYLEKLELLYCDISDKDVMNLIESSSKVRSLTVGSPVDITDEEIFTLFSENAFPNLEELIFSFAQNLTTVSVQLLCSNCPSLKVLGTLTEWGVTKSEFVALKMLLHSTNTDLTLLPT